MEEGLLKPGGVMVGPFEDDDEGDQSLQRIERLPTHIVFNGGPQWLT